MLQAVLGLLQTNTIAVWVKRNFPNTLDIADYPAIVMFDGGADYQELSPTLRQYVARVEVLCAVEAADTDDLGAAMSELRASVLVAMAANPTLGGLVSLVQHVSDGDPEMSFEQGRAPEMHMTMLFTIDGEENATDPTLPQVP